MPFACQGSLEAPRAVMPGTLWGEGGTHDPQSPNMTDGKLLLNDLQALPNCEPLTHCTSDVDAVPIPKLRASSAVTCAKDMSL